MAMRWGPATIGSTTNAGAITSRQVFISGEIPRGPIYQRAIFAANLAGGASGTVGIQIFTNVDGITVQIAGRTGLTTPGDYQIWGGVHQGSSAIDNVPRPAFIVFSGTGTGSSYNATVSMSAVD